tara:strand:+ start:108 stop:959 length:852 start_codon:yes stop_codon:yes gene_type:complete
MQKVKIGFIGQGFIGKNYADDFENRGFHIVRYALEEPHYKNEEHIETCDIVFIAVPTPTTPEGFDSGIIRKVIKLVGKGKIAVIKSTILPGTTESIQKENPDILVMHSPEFLTEVTASEDAAHPDRNIIGIPEDSQKYKDAAQRVIDTLPKAPYESICNAKEAELTKYGGNCWFYFKVIFINMLYDLSKTFEDVDWDVIQKGMTADSRIGGTHLNPIHKSGRGAGGNCFIKDFATFSEMYNRTVGDNEGKDLLERMNNKNIKLLCDSNKDLGLLKGVYGNKIK